VTAGSSWRSRSHGPSRRRRASEPSGRADRPAALETDLADRVRHRPNRDAVSR
jgi:hypothetical protein